MKTKLVGVVSPGGAAVNALYDNKEFNELFGYLWGRWQDESEHEDIADYQLRLEKYVTAAGLKIIKMTKRPFGFHAQFNDMVYAVTTTGWKRIK